MKYVNNIVTIPYYIEIISYRNKVLISICQACVYCKIEINLHNHSDFDFVNTIKCLLKKFKVQNEDTIYVIL